jgi:hypothetical protein
MNARLKNCFSRESLSTKTFSPCAAAGSASHAAVNEDHRPPADQDDFAQSAEISDGDIPF